MNDQIEAWTTNEGLAKVASLTLIGRGAAFSFRKIDDKFVITVHQDHVSAFHKDVEIVRPEAG